MFNRVDRIADKLLEQFAAAVAPSRLAAPPPMHPSWEDKQPVVAPYDFRIFGEEGYKQCVVIYCCVSARNLALIEPPLVLRRKKSKSGTVEDSPITDHPVQELLTDPVLNPDNPEQTGRDFQEGYWNHCNISGNAYMLITRAGSDPEDTTRLPARLDLLMPQYTFPIREADGIVRFFKYENGNVRTIFPAKNIIHMKYGPDPNSPWLGISPMAVAARQGQLDNQVADYMLALMTNAGLPGIIIQNTKYRVKDEDKLDIRQTLINRFAGKKAGSPMILDPEWSVVDNKAFSPKDMNVDKIIDVTETRIAAAYQVPVEVLGVLAGIDSTYANYREGRRIFHDKLGAFFRKGENKFTQLAAEYDPDLFFEYDFSEVGWLQEMRAEQAEFSLKEFQAGVLTYYEYCDARGKKPAEVNGVPIPDFRLTDPRFVETPLDPELIQKQKDEEAAKAEAKAKAAAAMFGQKLPVGNMPMPPSKTAASDQQKNPEEQQAKKKPLVLLPPRKQQRY